MPLLQTMAGQKILFEGRPAPATLLIISGEIELFTVRNGAKRMVARLTAGDILGEIEILTHSASQLSALATKDCTFLPIPPEDFERHLTETDPIISYLLKLMAQRLRGMVAEFTFSNLSAAGHRPTLDPVVVANEFWTSIRKTESDQEKMSERKCQAGESIFRIGEPSDYAYIMLEGQAEVFLPNRDGGDLTSLAKIGAGELFGKWR